MGLPQDTAVRVGIKHSHGVFSVVVGTAHQVAPRHERFAFQPCRVVMRVEDVIVDVYALVVYGEPVQIVLVVAPDAREDGLDGLGIRTEVRDAMHLRFRRQRLFRTLCGLIRGEAADGEKRQGHGGPRQPPASPARRSFLGRALPRIGEKLLLLCHVAAQGSNARFGRETTKYFPFPGRIPGARERSLAVLAEREEERQSAGSALRGVTEEEHWLHSEKKFTVTGKKYCNCLHVLHKRKLVMQ